MINASDANNLNLYNNFSNVNLSSNKEFLKNVYASQPKVQYYNDTVTISKKEKKKKKIFKASFIGASAIAGGALILKVLKNKGGVDFSQLSKLGKEAAENSSGAFKKVVNVADNFVNIKDDIWDKFANKTQNTPFSFIRKASDSATNLYKRALGAAMHQKYEKAVTALKEAGYSGKLPDFNSWYEKINNDVYNTLHKKGEKVTDNLFTNKKDLYKKVTSSNIADGKIASILKEQYIEIPENASQKLKDAINEYNGVKGTLLPKIRDINCGSAPTDFITIIASTLGLGVATACADTKEEKKSILVNLGIPLLVTLGSTTYGTMKALSGAKSLIFGLVTGQAASLGAGAIDKFLLKGKPEGQKNENNKK